MAREFDLVIRNGLVVDGTGAASREADIAIKSGCIADVGKVAGAGVEEIDAKGQIVTPGFVDIHTHYDGQVTWTNRLAPSSLHGVTSVAMGNCGVGFAPCRPTQHDQLIKLMDGVEDIPDVVLSAGVPWKWETFPEYLDFLASRTYDIDFGAYIPHAALRVYTMGERGTNCEPATDADIALMSKLVCEAVEAGALGFGTSRVLFHQTRDGKPIPTLKSSRDELMGLALGLKQAGGGVIQFVGHPDVNFTFEELRDLARASGRPLTISLLAEHQRWFEQMDEARREGLFMSAQILPRPTSFLLGHELTLNPFYATAPYQALGGLSFAQKIAELRKPEVRAAILKAEFKPIANSLGTMVRNFQQIWRLGDPPNYEPSAGDSFAAEAARRGVTPEELAYDAMLEKDGRTVLFCAAANYSTQSLDQHMTAFTHESVVLGLGDGGAHCGTVCDASYSTFMLTHWVRDRPTGRWPLQTIVKRLTSDTAEVVGFRDRGRIARGYRADLNVIDFDRMQLHAPRLVQDLPAGGMRLLQDAEGYVATIVKGEVTYREGRATGALPGRLVRGAQPAPA
jgi:N-acyl-D-aspartate/D-glutamate deacylase